jgi:hypothetical protein
MRADCPERGTVAAWAGGLVYCAPRRGKYTTYLRPRVGISEYHAIMVTPIAERPVKIRRCQSRGVHSAWADWHACPALRENP